MTSATVAGYTISGLDNAAGVQSAAQAYQNNPGNATLVAYQAALASAAAAATSLVPGEGAAFAGNSIIANISNIITNGASMSANDLSSAFASIAGNIATMAGQGVEFLGLTGSSINPIFGGGAFTLGELINAVGFIASATGAGIDSATIASVISQNLQSAGLSPDSSGNYSPASLSSSNFVCDSSNAATMWDIVQGNNVDQISATQQSGDGVATIISNGGNDDIIVSPGIAGSDFNLTSNGGNSAITGVNSGSTSGGNFTVNGSQNSTSASNSNISVGANSIEKVNGSANDITVAGPGSAVTIGGNGQSASASNDNYVNFASGVSGTVTVEGNSRTDVSGSGLTIYASGNESLGVTGSGNTVDATGVNDGIWLNGANAVVNLSGQGDSIYGSNDTIYGQNSDTFTVNGSGDTITDGTSSTTHWKLRPRVQPIACRC
ncbi:beta strand repeat-containing protein [Burkholderia pyrrocinia]|uniref:beta strand repeat-containing protein n=1 Tax=Burkholderia pyrrocinia TaxID=60550 RepID=UPI000AE2C4B7|nr:hypothetical protein [Burkholderia pyrrocinia]